MLDRRALLVKEMSEIAGVTVAPRALIAVSIGGITLVDGTEFRQMQLIDNPQRDGLVRIAWDGLDRDVNFQGGQMRALMEGRDELIPQQMADLDAFAKELIERTNEVHRQGYGLGRHDRPRLRPARIRRDIRLSDDISDLRNIAASADGSPGDGTTRWNSLASSRKRFWKTARRASVSSTLRSSAVSASRAEKAERMQEHQGVVMQHLTMLRESVSGVNFDEEMSNIVMAQHAYVAAAGVMSALDEALETLITRVGIVGR